ncbi:hypothetical protein [Acidimangrovimonas sediminis]|uniref:hypothetical protein n=1 Tax=Acidimangrovimonas sediminis TaxID=2056283 RepID=UPI0011AED9A1|nr:hypothetical protein [Acidimangrovimonas sediminis]
MKPIVPLLCLLLAACPALAEAPPVAGPGAGAPPKGEGAMGEGGATASGGTGNSGKGEGSTGDVSKGFDLMQEGTKLMLRGLTAQMEPKMRAMMATLVQLMGDLSAYEAPQVLPNGDILIRRKVPLVPVPPGDSGNETEL